MGQSIVCKELCCEEEIEDTRDEVSIGRVGHLSMAESVSVHAAGLNRTALPNRSGFGVCDDDQSPLSNAIAAQRASKNPSASMMGIAMRYTATDNRNQPIRRYPSAVARPVVQHAATMKIVPPYDLRSYKIGSPVEIRDGESSKWFKAKLLQIDSGQFVIQYEALDGIVRLMRVPVGHTDIRPAGKHKMTLLREDSSSNAESGDENYEGDDEFSITIHRQGNADLGMEMITSSGSLMVAGVREGLVHQWNMSHPDREILRGHVIVEVNGERGDAQTLRNALSRAEVLKITVASDAPSEESAES